jgi:hypothetical protein
MACAVPGIHRFVVEELVCEQPMLKHLLPIVAATLLLLIIWASAIPLFHWFADGDAPDLYAERRAQWQSLGVDSYEFTVQKNCFCGPPANIPVRFIVRDSLGIAAYDVNTGGRLAADDAEGVPDSVAGLFEVVQAAHTSQAASVAVVYDEAWGFQQNIQIDQDAHTVDDEVSYVVTNFRVLDEESIVH